MLVFLLIVGRVFVVGEFVFGFVLVVIGFLVLISFCVYFFSLDDWNVFDSGSGESSDDYKFFLRVLFRYMFYMIVM